MRTHLHAAQSTLHPKLSKECALINAINKFKLVKGNKSFINRDKQLKASW